ncbi:MAG TPA: lipopolysaccharide kinase InaA family protein [Gemmataceae bacterium]|nr:lipopolysaccharide kinase InaA family protein [Gemmataceae bacterium]
MTATVAFTSAGVRWQAAPELIDRGVLCFDGLRPSHEFTIVKQGPQCTVYRVALSGLDVHVKHYHPADARSRARSMVRQSKARAEAARLRETAARGVPTLEVLAVGEATPDSGARGSCLVTRTLAGARSLTAFLEEEFPLFDPARRARVRQALAAALGRLLARMHDAGVVHADLHPGNLLLRLDSDDQPELHLIDLYAVRFSPPLDWPRSRDNLVVLNRWFILRATRSDRLRCWRAYREARALPCGSRLYSEEAVRELEGDTLLSNLDFWRSRDRRCLGGNRWFRRVGSAAVRGYAAADVDPGVLAPMLADADEPFRRSGVVVLKDSPSSTVIEFDMRVGAALRRVIYKRFAMTRWTDPLAALFRSPPAMRSYIMGHGLRLRGLPTPRPLAVWHRTRFGLLREGYLLTEKVHDASDVVDHAASLGRLPSEARRVALGSLIGQTARLVATLHARRLSHRDLKAANLLVNAVPCRVGVRGAVETTASGRSVEQQIWFIDLVGVRRQVVVSPLRRARNLARLYASFHGRGLLTRTDLLRFLRIYLGWGLRGWSDWKSWWTAIAQAFCAKVRRNRRNRRPLR